MKIFLIRHANAGQRTADPHDLYRPLVEEGHERARSLADLLADAGITSVLSSPATRCVQTVEPLAAVLNLTVREHPDLWEGSAISHVLALLGHHRDGALAVCSHGDIIPEVIEAVGAAGATIQGRGCEKGSVWILDYGQDGCTGARYLDRSQQKLPVDY